MYLKGVYCLMKQVFLDFEKPIEDLLNNINELRCINDNSACGISDDIDRLNNKLESLTKSIFSKLTPFQISKLSRHPQRPYTNDYIKNIFTNFEEFHGDRQFSDDKAIVGGIGKLDGQTVMVIGHQKGRDTKEKVCRNFGMSKPEGYRKALRFMHLAQKFQFPIITFVDTPGAYPGIDAEERGQSEAIGRNLYELASLRVPIICNIIGEGGSGGALAIAVGDYINMLEYATYSVISPEGCASILWKTSDKASDASQALCITARNLFKFNLIDNIIKEPIGGAHRNYEEISIRLKKSIKAQLDILKNNNIDDILNKRFKKIMNYGKYIDK